MVLILPIPPSSDHVPAGASCDHIANLVRIGFWCVRMPLVTELQKKRHGTENRFCNRASPSRDRLDLRISKLSRLSFRLARKCYSEYIARCHHPKQSASILEAEKKPRTEAHA